MRFVVGDKLTIHIESSVEDYIYNHINDLKSYIDVKTDSSGLNSKIDSIGTDLRRSAEDMLAASRISVRLFPHYRFPIGFHHKAFPFLL